MLITIIVPAFNEAGLLPESLDRIKRSAAVLHDRGWRTQLVVCDNNSTDATAEIARAAGAEVIFEPINQIARARNRGASIAQGDWLWFIDADSHPSAELFAATAAEVERGRAVAIGTTFKFENVDPIVHLAAGIWKMWSLLFSHMAGSYIAVEARAFSEIGGFSDQFFAGEELDLSIRLRRWGKAQSPTRRVKVLSGVPLLTSGRKARLYTWRENCSFLVRTLFSPLRTLKRRESCYIWYDGRRE